MSGGLTYTTRCNLCGQTFNHHSIVDLVGANPEQAGKVFNALREHIEKKHQKEDLAAQLAAQTLLGLLRTRHFTSQDQSANQIREFQRWQLAEMLRATHVPDEKIIEQSERLELPSEFRERVIACLKLMRDIIEERGPFTPPNPLDQTNPASRSAQPARLVQ